MVAATALVLTPTLSMAQQLPSGGSVAAGSATISSPNAATLNVNQSSDRAIINWNSFSVGQGGTVNFLQPGASSATLNRVTGTTPSSIAGSINAPGTVLLVNPNGIAITPTGTVNVGSFAASTLNIKDSDFMSGNYTFSGNGASAAVTNAGRINVSDGGFAALLGGQVANDGLISARLGKVGLGSGELITLDLAGDGFLSVAVPTSSLGGIVGSDGRPLVSNKGKIIADGGTVHLSAATAAGLLRDAVNVPGTIRANSVGTRNGKIIIGGGAGGKVQISGKVTASGGRTARGGSIDVSGAKVAVSGKVKASGTTGGRIKITGTESAKISGEVAAKGKTGNGGVVVITAKDVTIESSGKLDVSGTTGGTLLVGGDYQGGANVANNFSTDPVANAETTTVAAGATLRAAGTSGQGGRVVVWSDDTTTFAGALDVSGQGGAGGFAEVSGHRLLDFTGTAALAGTAGAGTLLLDPRNIVISNANSSGGSLSGGTFTPSADDSVLNIATLQAALASGNVVVTTGLSGSAGSQDGNITVASAISWSGSNTLTLTAANNIAINADITAASGGLTINAVGGVTATGGINVGQFTLQSGAWVQNGSTLPSFAATSFTIAGGSFLRVTGGAGNAGSPYQIADVYGLQGIGSSSALLAASYVLANDVDATGTANWNSGAGFVPIGNSTTKFSGSFDGLGHTISGLTIHRSSTDQVGLFGSGSASSAISRLTMANVDIIGHVNVGGLIGQSVGTVTAVSVSGSVVASNLNVGGVAGQLASGGSISDSQSSATVEGYIQVGGLVGGLAGGTISRSNATGIVKGRNNGSIAGNAGGLVGAAANGGSISDSYSTASVSAGGAGGLIGTTNGAVTLSNVWSSGRVSSQLPGGGVIYQQFGSAPVMSGVYWDATTTGVANACGSGTCSGATALTTAQALTQSSYSGFDFTNTWFMIDGSTRPFLRSEYSTTISNAHQLQLIAMNATTLGASYTLAGDIALGTALANPSEMWGSAGFVPIGSASAQFKGSLDGKGHVISGLVINRPSNDDVGLFGYIGSTGSRISNLGVVDARVSGGTHVGIVAADSYGTLDNVWSSGVVSGGYQVGGLVGYAHATISGSHSDATVTATGDGVGGLVGMSASTAAMVTGSYATGAVSGASYVGGLVGQSAGPIELSFATGTVSGTSNYIGGLLGYADAGVTITNTYATGAVNAYNRAGGLVGYFGGITVSNSFATGYVTSSGSSRGGLIAKMGAGTVTNSYWDTQTSGLSTSDGGTGVTTATLQAALPSGWNTATWGIIAGVSYPFLKSFWSGTPQVVSGTAYTNNGVTPASGGNVAVMVNGAAVGSASAGANGYYNVLLAPGTIGSNSQLVSFTSGTNAGVSYVQNAAGSITGLNILGNTLVEQSAASTLSSISSGLAVAIGSSGVSTALANRWIVATGSSFTIDQAISQTGNLVLSSNGTVTQTAGASISAATLKLQYISSGISYSLTDSGNAVSSLQPGNLGSGSLDFYSSTDLSVGAFTANGGLLIRTAGALTLAGPLSSSATGNAVVLSAGTGFVNNAGSSAISVPNGRWLVYAAAPTGNTFNNLDSGNTAVWNATYAANAPATIASGNRYVFAYQPTLTFSSTDASKYYGATADVSSSYTVTGASAGVSGAFKADTLSSLYTGTPVLSSAGAAGTATVAGGPYLIDIAQGSVASTGSYALNFVSSGQLTVNKASLIIYVSTAYKTYGTGYTGSSSDYSVSGLQNSDKVTGVTLTSDGAAATAIVGSYGLNASAVQGIGLDNYNVMYSQGTLVVSKASLTITASNGSKVYGNNLTFAGTEFTVSGLHNSDAVSSVTLTSGGAAATANANSYQITASNATGTGLSNYLIYYNAGYLSVTPAPLTITANDRSKTYGSALPLGSTDFTLSGSLYNNDKVDGVTFTSAAAGATAAVGWSTIYANNATGTGLANYSISYVTGKLTVNPAPLTITANDATKTYGAAWGGGGYSVSGALYNGDTISGVSLSSTGAGTAANVGTYAITASGATGTGLYNYAITYQPGTLTVNPAPLTITANDQSKIYGASLDLGSTAYTVTGNLYNGNKINSVTLASDGAAAGGSAGSHAITASAAQGDGLSNYAITYADGTLTVNKATLIIYAGSANKTYGTTYNSTSNFVASGLLNGDNVNSVTLSSAGAAATATVASYGLTPSNAQGTGLSNYNIYYQASTLQVSPATLTITAANATKTYGTDLSFVGTEFTASGLTNGDTVSGVTLSSAGAAASKGTGTYQVTASAATGTGLSNYLIYYNPGSLNVTPAPLTITANNQSKTYGSAISLDSTAFTVTGALYNNDKVTGVTLSSFGTNATAAAGGSTIYASNATGSGLNNYSITYATGWLTVNPAPLTITANDASKTYGAVSGMAGYSVTGSLYNGDTLTSVTLSSAGAYGTAGVGSYSISASGAAGTGIYNYAITYLPGTLTVNPAPLTITANGQSKVYGNTIDLGSTAYTVSGSLYNGDKINSVTLASDGAAATAAAGPHAIIASAAQGNGLSNYAITYADGALTVNKATLIVYAGMASKIYGDTYTSTSDFTTSGLKNADKVVAVTLGSTGAAATAGVGNYDLIASAAIGSGLSNYAISYQPGTLQVSPAILTITGTDLSKVYGSARSFSGTEFTATGLVNGDTVDAVSLSSAGAAASANVGSYQVAVSGASGNRLGNYLIYYNAGNLVVTQAPLTVTALDQHKTYGTDLALGSTGFSTTGTLFNGDKIDGVTLLSGGAGVSGTVGTYGLTASNAVGSGLSNYAITYVAGTLTVDRAPLTITANDRTKTYGDMLTFGPNGYTVTGSLYNSDTINAVNLASAGVAATANAGGYTITASGVQGAGLENYAITYASGSLTVNKADLTVTAANATKTYDGQAFTGGNGVGYAGFVNNENTSVLGGTLAYGGTAQGAVNAGSYTLTASGLTSSNYNISYVAGGLTVNRAVISAIAVADDKVYDGTTTATGSIVGFNGVVQGDAVNVGGSGTFVFADANVGSGKTVAVSGLTLSGASAGNYILSTTASSSASITPATLTIASAGSVAGSKVYDGNTSAAVTGNGTLAGVIGGDVVGLLLGGTVYADKNVGTGKTVTGSYSLTGAGASNYVLSSSGFTGSADITAATLTIASAGSVAGSKIYDGGTSAAVTGNGTLSGVLNGDAVSLLLGGTVYADKNVGTGKTVTGGYSLTGAGAGNYVLSSTGFTGSADITPATLTIASAGSVAGSKVYDGNTSAAVTGNGSLSGVIGGDAVSLLLGGTVYADKNVGTGKTVTGSYSLTGAGAGNYALSSTGFTGSADITPATLTIASAGSVAGSKVYDGNTSAAVTGNGTLAGVINDDAVSLLLAGTAYADKNVGTGKTVTGSYSLTGAGAGNYVLASTGFTGSADITAATLTIASAGSVAGSKVYDGTTSAMVAGNGTLAGVIGSDEVTLLLGGTSYADKNVGTGKAVTGSYSLSGAGAGNYVLASTGFTGSADITPATLTIASAGTVAGSKVYDGNTSASVTGNGTLAGVIGGDAVSLLLAGTAYADKNVGTGKTVTGSYSLSGAGASNYVLSSTGFTGSADITPATLTIASAGTVAGSKVYDGNTSAAVTGNGTLAGVLNGDAVSLLLAGTVYADKNVGAGKTVTGSYSLTGAGASNYVLASTGFTGAADITPATLTIASAGSVAGSKVYDGTTSAAVTGNGTLSGVLNGDAVSLLLAGTAYADKNVGTGKTVTGSYSLSGADAGNYMLASTGFIGSADITAAMLSIASAGSVAASKVYDGTTAAAVTGNGTLSGVINGDVVGLLLAGTAYADKNVGTGKTVTGSYSLTGAEAGNYVLATTGFTGAADITPATLTIASAGTVAGTKVYDGSTSAAVTGNGTLSGVFGSDAVALLLSGAAYADKNVGAGKAVTGSYSLTGAGAGNYVLATTGFAGVADIAPATLTLASNGSVAASKVYDGTTAAAVTGNGTLSGVIGSDEVALLLAGIAYADKNVGTGKTVTGSYGLTGAGAGNYVLASTGFIGAADITPRAITVAAEPGSKTSGTADPVFGFSLINGSLVAGDSLSGALSRDPGESVGSYAILQGTLAASQNYLLSYVGADFTILAAPTTPTVTATNSGDYPTSQYFASGSESTPVAVTISYQQPASPVVPVIAAIRAAAPVVRTAGNTGDANQNIAVGAGAGTLFRPISQFDNQQYSKAELPGFAPEAAEAAVLTMIARGETNDQQPFKIDALWGDGAASWSRLDHPDVRAVSFTDGNGTERVPGGGNAFAFVGGQTDVAALLRKGPVVLQGGKTEGVPTPWLLVLSVTADGKGLLANDPMTGQQVILAFDSATKSVGGVTAVINPADKQPAAVGDAVPPFVAHADKITPAMWTALKAFKPAGYFAVTM
ncbi:YDG domain-containing protein [Rhodopseudomonas palustris]|nr:YDG domain-containing protein [Rhodopseudomonas palustris]